jgi:multiple antibiotic resistance protein
MADFINAFLLIYVGLFPIINPVGGARIFLGLTSTFTKEERNTFARGVAINSVFLLAGSMFVGSHLLVFFGITLPVVRIAGGLVLMAFAWKLLQTGGEHEDQRSASAAGHRADIDSFYPLTMPLTVGPGSISVAIALGSQRPAGPMGMQHLALLGAAAIAAILALAITIYICYRFAERIIALLGKHGTNVFIRLSAFILLCIGIQVLWTGYSTLVAVPK